MKTIPITIEINGISKEYVVGDKRVIHLMRDFDCPYGIQTTSGEKYFIQMIFLIGFKINCLIILIIIIMKNY